MYAQTHLLAHRKSYHHIHTQRYTLLSLLHPHPRLVEKLSSGRNWARGSSKVNLLKLEVSVKVLFSGTSQMGQSLSIRAASRGQETGGSGLTGRGKR